MKIGLAQLNSTVGDISGNGRKVREAYQRLVAAGAEIVVFPEMVVPGYPPRDLLFKSRFVSDNEAELVAIAAATGDVPAVVGFVAPNPGSGRPFFNAAAWCRRGRIEAIGSKSLLPTYDVFDEDRYFEPAESVTVVPWDGRKVALTICEDLWTESPMVNGRLYRRNPVAEAAAARPDLLVNLSASPWHRDKGPMRQAIVAAAARRVGCPVAYCNLVGGNDELVFDGQSLVYLPDGSRRAGLAGFAEDEQVIDLGPGGKPFEAPLFQQEPWAKVESALVLGLRDYARKSGFRQALVGLSGGIDSALVAVLAARALGAENVTGVSLPSAISSDHSRADAAALAANLGIRFLTIPIAGAVDSALAALSPVLAGGTAGVTEENVQARIRGLLLMGISNREGSLLLTTGNKSELAVGYCTLYGDMAGGLAVISDLPKTDVYGLSRWINRDGAVIPSSTLTKEPSAELRPGQKDRDSLPDYAVLDAILERYVERGESQAQIVTAGYDPAVVADVVRKVDCNEYKRKQAAPGLKITPLAFGVGRRIPIVQRYVAAGG